METSNEPIRVRARPMRDGFGILLRSIFQRFFSPVRFSPSQEDRLRGLAGKGHLVYVMYNSSVLHYLFINFWCLRLQLPLASYGNGIPAFLVFQPLRRIFRTLIDALRALAAGEPSNARIPLSDFVQETLEQRRSLVLFLRHSRFFRKRSHTEPVEMLKALLAFQSTSHDPVFLVPMDILWGKKPVKIQRNIVDVTLGDKESSGSIRQTLMLLRHSRQSVATLGHVMNLKTFRQENAHVEEDLLRKKIRWSLHRELTLAGKQITGPRLKPRKYIIQSILSSMRLRTLAREMARAEGTSFDKVMKRASRFAHEIAADYNIAYIVFLDRVLTWVWNNIYSGFSVDRKGIEAVKRASRNGSLILLPSHKSHIDYLVLSYAFYHNDLPPPHIAAGVNLSFWPLGRIFRKAGAFFMRRTFRGQPLYSTVFQTYIKWLQREGYVQEFFLEGTRSRTGKLMNPKLGLLSMELDIFSEGLTEDLYLVPISINYEKVVEESSYTDESGGAKKERERFRDLLKTPKFLRKKYGRVYIQFGDPLSVRDHLQSRHVDYSRLGTDGRSRIAADLAQRTAYAINEVTTVTPSSLVATVLMNHDRRGITREEVHRRASFLFSLLRDMKVRCSLSLQNLPWAVDEALEVFVSDKAIQAWDDPEGTIYTLDEGRRLPMNFYKNNILHFFLPLAFSAASFRMYRSTRLEEPRFLQGLEFFFQLFSREFIFPPEQAMQVYNETVGRLLVQKRGILLRDEPGWLAVQKAEPFAYIGQLLMNFFESYFIFLKAAGQILASEDCEEKDLIKKILEFGDRLYRQGDLLRPESRSVFVFRNALSRMRELGMVHRKEKKSGALIGLTQKGKTEIPRFQEKLTGLLENRPVREPHPLPTDPVDR